MIVLAFHGVLARRAQSLIAMLGLLVTLVGFTGLAAGAQSTTAQLNGDIGRAWDTPFDLLVRPVGAAEPLERSDGLVRPNYVSGIHGGITAAQLTRIRKLRGVTLAAPLAAVGAVNWPSAYELRVPADSRAQLSVYRVTTSVRGQAGLSRYPVETRYVVVAPRGRLVFESGQLTVPGRSPISCGYPVNCFAGTVCFGGDCSSGSYPSTSDARYYLPLLQPIQVAGIDPRAEARLTGLDRCVHSGRLLTDHDVLSSTEDPEPAEVLPVMASTRAFLDQVLQVEVATANPGTRGEPTSIRRWTRTEVNNVSLQGLYRSYLAGSVPDYLDSWPIWTAGDVRYRRVGADHLAAEPVRPDPFIYRRANAFLEVGISDALLVPPEVADPWLRSVTEHADSERPGDGSSYRSKMWDVVGQYDPRCLAGFDRLAGATMEAYATPEVLLPTGRPLAPSRAMSDYVASPPLLLTTLEGARWLADPDRYRGQPGDAYISVVRVRVRGTSAPGPASQRRLTSVAVAIHDRTGLQVDIVKGSSTRPVMVDLPAGSFGRPALTVQEQWSVKGVALRFVQAVRNQDRALLWLLLAGAGTLVGQASFIAVRQRRRQLAVLRALGWSAGRIAALVEVETLMTGAVAGVLALLVTPVVGLVVPVSPSLAATTPVIGMAIAGLAGLPAAWAASRGRTAQAMSGRHPMRQSRPPATTAGLAMRELRRAWPAETAVAVLAVALGAGLEGLVVLVAADFRGDLDATVLGADLHTQVRPFHVVLAALTLALGSAAVVQVVLLAWLSRRPQLGVLRAMGWSGARLASLVCWQALAIAAGGLAIAAPLVLACAHLLGAPADSAGLALAVTAGCCLAATIAAAAGPGVIAFRSPALRLLAVT